MKMVVRMVARREEREGEEVREETKLRKYTFEAPKASVIQTGVLHIIMCHNYKHKCYHLLRPASTTMGRPLYMVLGNIHLMSLELS